MPPPLALPGRRGPESKDAPQHGLRNLSSELAACRYRRWASEPLTRKLGAVGELQLREYELNVSKEAELLFQVEPQGGELVVDVGKEDSFEGRILAVWQGDIGLPLGTLIQWTEGHGVRFLEDGQVRIPQLAPGNYTVCLGAPTVIDPGEIEEWKKSRATCASGYLTAASALDLRLN